MAPISTLPTLATRPARSPACTSCLTLYNLMPKLSPLLGTKEACFVWTQSHVLSPVDGVPLCSPATTCEIFREEEEEEVGDKDEDEDEEENEEEEEGAEEKEEGAEEKEEHDNNNDSNDNNDKNDSNDNNDNNDNNDDRKDPFRNPSPSSPHPHVPVEKRGRLNANTNANNASKSPKSSRKSLWTKLKHGFHEVCRPDMSLHDQLVVYCRRGVVRIREEVRECRAGESANFWRYCRVHGRRREGCQLV